MKTRKEMREEYKQMKFQMGVFQIRNLQTGRIYIGSSNDLQAFWRSQKFQLEAGMHSNSELQADWNQFGAEQFIYEILEEIKPSDDTSVNYDKDIKALEELMIEALQPFDENGYNRRKTGKS